MVNGLCRSKINKVFPTKNGLNKIIIFELYADHFRMILPWEKIELQKLSWQNTVRECMQNCVRKMLSS